MKKDFVKIRKEKAGSILNAKAKADELILKVAALIHECGLPAVLAATKRACIRLAKDTLLADKNRTEQGDSVRTLLDFSERIQRLEDSAGLKNPLTRVAYIKAGGRLPSRTDKARWEKRSEGVWRKTEDDTEDYDDDEFTDEDRRKAELEELG